MALPYEPGFLYAFTALLGACFGSFSNVLIHRLPRNLSVVRPRSACPSCGRAIAWHENIPVLSWLLLRARCRGCAAPIASRYVLVELAGAACALIGVWRFGFTFAGLSASLLLLLLLDIALIDWEHMIIPHTLTIAGIVIGLGGSFLDGRDPAAAFLGAAVGAGSILAVSWGYRLVRGVIGMGGGDVMLMGMVGRSWDRGECSGRCSAARCWAPSTRWPLPADACRRAPNCRSARSWQPQRPWCCCSGGPSRGGTWAWPADRQILPGGAKRQPARKGRRRGADRTRSSRYAGKWDSSRTKPRRIHLWHACCGSPRDRPGPADAANTEARTARQA
ncbi:MAG: prepilin peptidase [bacterium]|nr:prepilin peptidase [bacterium]